MDQKIFELGLSVQGTSLYLILDSLLSDGQNLSLENVKARWLDSEQQLTQSIQELEGHGIVEVVGNNLLLRPAVEWIVPLKNQ